MRAFDYIASQPQESCHDRYLIGGLVERVCLEPGAAHQSGDFPDH